MAIASEQVGHSALVGGGETSLHSHAGGGGANVKSGLVSGMAYGTQAVSFGASFGSTPRVVASFASAQTRAQVVNTESVSTTGFTLRYTKIGGGANENSDIVWVATDAGS